MFKKHLIYKTDNYNMLTVEVQGKTIVVREISDQWGEDNFKFISRPELLHWAEQRFRIEDFKGREAEYAEIMENIRKV